DVIGIGTHPSRGLKKGVIVNIDSTVAAIKQAILEAEGMSGCEISQVYVGIAGGHIKGVNSTGTVAIKDKEVRESDVHKVLELARAIALPVDRHIVHVLPQEYKIDGQDGVREPLGMCGVRLEARVHIVTAAAAAAHNIIKCCTRCDLEVLDIVREPLASAEAVPGEDEKGLGVARVGIGGGTTQLAGMTELGEEILGIPVRRGAPKGVGGLAEVVRNAAFSTAVGLVQYGVGRQLGERPSGESPKRSGGGLFSRLRRSLSNA